MKTIATRSAATEPPPKWLTDAREAYEDGTPLRVLRRRLHLSESEAQDLAPEEFDMPQGNPVSGY